jgi:hypothetical protein
MVFNNKKEIQKLWESIEPYFISQLPNNINITDTDYSMGFNRDTYLAIQLNNKWIFFIFNTEESSITVFSHDTLPLEILEKAVFIKNILLKILFAKQIKVVKAGKTD